MPFDNVRPANLSYQGQTFTIQLSKQILQSLKNIAYSHNASLFMVLLSALNVLLYRYTNQETLVVGSPIAGRLYHGVEDLIGLFVNTVALRVDLTHDICFIDLLKQVKEATLNAYNNQDIPFELLLKI